jgi:hypothetical protein
MKVNVRIASLSIESENLDSKVVGEVVGRIIATIIDGSTPQPQLTAGKKPKARKPASTEVNQ